jgi:hypothetical protein
MSVDGRHTLQSGGTHTEVMDCQLRPRLSVGTSPDRAATQPLIHDNDIIDRLRAWNVSMMMEGMM